VASIRLYQTDPTSAEEVMRQVNEGFIPIIKDAETASWPITALNVGALSTELPSRRVFSDTYASGISDSRKPGCWGMVLSSHRCAAVPIYPLV
jgi:hypothetical protein